jgi:Fur family ferric uptake transcriptional regulator
MQTPAPNQAREPDAPPLCAIFRRHLKREGLKFTPERAKVLDATLKTVGVFEADRLYLDLRGQGHRVSKATLYRTLKHLCDAGIITEVVLGPNQAHYELSFGQQPKGYLVCVHTHRIVEFNTADLTDLRDRICAEHGFTPVSHRLVIHGLSPEARKAAANDRGSKPSAKPVRPPSS